MPGLDVAFPELRRRGVPFDSGDVSGLSGSVELVSSPRDGGLSLRSEPRSQNVSMPEAASRTHSRRGFKHPQRPPPPPSTPTQSS